MHIINMTRASDKREYETRSLLGYLFKDILPLKLSPRDGYWFHLVDLENFKSVKKEVLHEINLKTLG